MFKFPRLPKLTFYVVSFDGKYGIDFHLATSERQADDWILDTIGSSRDEFEDWMEDPETEAIEYCEVDFHGFVAQNTDGFETYKIDTHDVSLWEAFKMLTRSQ